MELETLKSFLLWCTILNFAVLFLWLAMLAFAREWMKRLHGRWFRLGDETFDAIHYSLMGLYKIGILLFFLMPLLALLIVS